MDRKNSVLATMFILGLVYHLLRWKMTKYHFSPLLLVLGASNVVRHYQASEQSCYFEELPDFVRGMVFWIWKMSKSYHIRPQKLKRKAFWRALLVIARVRFAYKYPLNRVMRSFWGVNQVSKTNSSRDMDFVTFCPARAISGLFPANRLWPKIWHLFFRNLLESYNQFLKRKWIYMEVQKGGNSAPVVQLALTLF